MTATTYLGKPTSRIEGPAKVTGIAKYAAEYNVPGPAHGFVVSSAIASGRIKHIHAADALSVEGVLDVFTHAHRPEMASSDDAYKDEVAPDGSPFRPLYDDRICFSGQPVALVVAEEFEIARFAASLVRVEYQQQAHVTDFDAQLARKTGAKHGPGPRARQCSEGVRAGGSARRGRISHAGRAPQSNGAVRGYGGVGRRRPDDHLRQDAGPQNCRNYVAGVFGMPHEKVRVLSPYVGGGFGSGLRPQYELPLAVLAARALKRSVRVTLTRQQMFTLGYRAAIVQELALGADRGGSLASFRHEAVAMTSQFEDFQRSFVSWSSLLYRCANSELRQRLVKLDQNTPCDMRAPGGAEGMYAIECAMDELAYAAKIDPLELRLINYSDKDQIENRPYSSKQLRECYRQGAERFGWSNRNPQPRSMRDGSELLGWGMATGIWEAMQLKASAKAVLTANGSVEIASATADIGPGTYTMMTQIAAEMLGVPLQHVTAKLGEFRAAGCAGRRRIVHHLFGRLRRSRRLPGGAEGTSRPGAEDRKGSPLAGAKLDDVVFAEGKIRHKHEKSREVLVAEAMRAGKADRIEKEAAAEPNEGGKYSHYAHSAVFAEVKIDEELGVIRVTRVVNAVAAGRILNPKLAGSQILGAVVGGIGMALHEETATDHRFGRFMTRNLADYHVPVNADVHSIDVIFVEENDEEINPLGVKGVGEIGIVGTAAAIANAVYHATGKRVRDLPITIDKLMRD